jgi:hypothetical protein
MKDHIYLHDVYTHIDLYNYGTSAKLSGLVGFYTNSIYESYTSSKF